MGMVQIALLALVATSLGLSAVAWRRDAPLDWRIDVPPVVTPGGAPHFETVFDYEVATGQAHSPAIAVTGAGFSILWFEGSEEAQADVDIFAADFSPAAEGWQVGAPQRRVTRSGLGDAFEPRQLVVTLGNTIENEGAEGGLYATVVSVGGWAMASVADVRMRDGVPTHARKLSLSPLLNRSFLVKSPMLAYADGSHALPAYFEMGNAFSALVRFAPDGRVRDRRRMPGRLNAIQPMIIPLDASRAVAFMRNFTSGAQRLLVSRTADGGQSWSEVRETDMPNPSAPVAALPLGGDRILMAANDDAEKADILRLVLSEDGGLSWRRLATLEDAGGDATRAARYPMLRRIKDGRIVLTYSIGTKRGVRAHVFNDAWVAAQ